ncbi:hypothetical protein CIHG_09071 [Coccidioides immitis H538.4]|nr:hypothetical protein CIRG_05896 [Coccidioides immitis RMSCC 2394]KMU78316.1 hypothetical protein CISG_06551 [Coccidioides immitis RMSCC 3703]KMU91259.1 hypothetical protein CIHG_09071 [Coccidioides immitis H538.4]
MSILSRVSPFTQLVYARAVILLLLCGELVSAGRLTHSHDFAKRTYKYGQGVPVSCLNRTIDAGEHVTDSSGKLQYIPFPTCNETSAPLSLRYGVSETVTCTIDSLPDTLYHLFEYYVHSDAPLACRVPTVPLLEPSKHFDPGATGEGSHDAFMEGGAPAPFTPLTIALQGTLQKSHLHVWSDMNVLIHRSADGSKKRKTGSKAKKMRGQIVAGAAYSIPSVDVVTEADRKKSGDGKMEVGDVRVPWDPWKAGEGAKVLRGEPLTFKFHVGWVQEPNVSGLGMSQGSNMTLSEFLYNSLLFVGAGCLGAVVALWWDHYKRRRSSLWNGDGLLGHPVGQGGFFGRKSRGVSINLGNGGKANGYGGYGFNGKNGASQGYGGYSSGKRD